MRALVRQILSTAVLTVALGSCSSDTTENTDINAVAGAYVLLTIDGQSLPVVVDQQGADIAEVIEGDVDLATDLTFTDVTTLRLTIGGVVTTEADPATGTWSVTGTTVRFTPTDGSPVYTMTWNGTDRLTQLFQGFTLVYEK